MLVLTMCVCVVAACAVRVSAPVQAQRRHLWVGLLLGLLLATVVALALSFLARRGGKVTQFGYGGLALGTTSSLEGGQEV